MKYDEREEVEQDPNENGYKDCRRERWERKHIKKQKQQQQYNRRDKNYDEGCDEQGED